MKAVILKSLLISVVYGIPFYLIWLLVSKVFEMYFAALGLIMGVPIR